MADKLWLPIKGWEKYEVSNQGEVRNRETGKILKQSLDRKNGYLYVRLQIGNRKKNFKIHRLVAEYFIPNPDGKPCVNHIDGNKLNNSVTNLEWVTHQENNVHALEEGLRIRTNNRPIIATRLETGERYYFNSASECARFIGDSRGNVSRVLIGKRKSAKGFTFQYQ